MSHLMNSLIATSLITTSAIAETDTWSPQSMLNTKVITDPQLSPDNNQTLFVATDYTLKDEKGLVVSRIFKSDHQKVFPLTGPNSSSMQPRWSPDGAWIAFVTKQDGVKNLYVMANSGSSPIAVTKGLKDIQTFAWSPDSKKIAFVMEDSTKREKAKEKTSNAITYKSEGNINRLWIVDFEVPGLNPKSLTNDEYNVKGLGDFGTINVEFDWSPDSKKIVFSHTPEMGFDSFYLDASIALIDISTNEITKFKNSSPFESQPRFSPDGKWIGYLKGITDQQYSVSRVVAIRSLDAKVEKTLASTPNGGPLLAGPNLLGWNKTADALLFFEPDHTRFNLYLVPIDETEPKALIKDKTFVREPALSPDKSHLSFVVQSSSKPPEVYVSTSEEFNPFQVSAINEKLLEYPKTRTELISWDSDGLNIEGLLTYPQNYKPGEKYPLLLVIHGGPMGFFDETFIATPFTYPLAAFAQEDYFILRPNPRGSTGYGIDFRIGNYKDWGGKDYLDLMRGVDAVIEKGFVDENRLGVMGWSYGGYMTSWIITQTDRFKAASTGAGISNLVSMNGTTDLDRFMSDYFGNDRDLMESRSPLNFIKNVKTPCLIQHGTDDKRVPVSQAFELFKALEREKKEVSLILYPGMGHRIPDSNMLRDAMQSNIDWFNRYLK